MSVFLLMQRNQSFCDRIQRSRGEENARQTLIARARLLLEAPEAGGVRGTSLATATALLPCCPAAALRVPWRGNENSGVEPRRPRFPRPRRRYFARGEERRREERTLFEAGRACLKSKQASE